jgi:hypothetical protein
MVGYRHRVVDAGAFRRRTKKTTRAQQAGAAESGFGPRATASGARESAPYRAGQGLLTTIVSSRSRPTLTNHALQPTRSSIAVT